MKIQKLFTIIVTSITFIGNTLLPIPAFAQVASPVVSNLPISNTMISVSPGFSPMLLKGLKIFPEEPLKFDFIVDSGESGLEGEALEDESSKLIKYFLAGLTVPEEDLWVNLSPYEEDRIIPQAFGETEMGRDLLAQDYILKQLTASLIYPENELGHEFWDRIYAKAYEKYGTTNIPINTFNKVWIVPKKAVVYEHEDKAFVIESHLAVMLEEDYLSMEKNLDNKDIGTRYLEVDQIEQLSSISSEVVRELILPEIEREVNEGENFAALRQIYHSLILASWFKKTLKESLLGKAYIDKNKILGIDVENKSDKDKIYKKYIKAFEQGVYDYIRTDDDPYIKRAIKRRYVSGGAVFSGLVTGDLVAAGASPIMAVVQNISEKDQTEFQELSLLSRIATDLTLQRNHATQQAIVASPIKQEVLDLTRQVLEGKAIAEKKLIDNFGYHVYRINSIQNIPFLQSIDGVEGYGIKKILPEYVENFYNENFGDEIEMVLFELASNVEHAESDVIILAKELKDQNSQNLGIEIVVQDFGRGIINIEKYVQRGQSTKDEEDPIGQGLANAYEFSVRNGLGSLTIESGGEKMVYGESGVIERSSDSDVTTGTRIIIQRMFSSNEQQASSAISQKSIKKIQEVFNLKVLTKANVQEGIIRELESLQAVDEWTALKNITQNDRVLSLALDYWLKENKQEDYSLDHVYINKRKKIFFYKNLIEENDYLNTSNQRFFSRNTFRDGLGTFIGNALGANVVNLIITSEGIFSEIPVDLGIQLPIKSKREAEVINLVLNVFIRNWDIQKGPLNRISVKRNFIAFDFEKGFNFRNESIDRYMSMLNFAMENLKRNRWGSSDFKNDAFIDAVEKIKRLNIPDVMDAFKKSLSKEINLEDRTTQDELRTYQKFLEYTQKTIEQDVLKVYQHIVGDTKISSLSDFSSTSSPISINTQQTIQKIQSPNISESDRISAIYDMVDYVEEKGYFGEFKSTHSYLSDVVQTVKNSIAFRESALIGLKQLMAYQEIINLTLNIKDFDLSKYPFSFGSLIIEMFGISGRKKEFKKIFLSLVNVTNVLDRGMLRSKIISTLYKQGELELIRSILKESDLSVNEKNKLFLGSIEKNTNVASEYSEKIIFQVSANLIQAFQNNKQFESIRIFALGQLIELARSDNSIANDLKGLIPDLRSVIEDGLSSKPFQEFAVLALNLAKDFSYLEKLQNKYLNSPQLKQKSLYGARGLRGVLKSMSGTLSNSKVFNIRINNRNLPLQLKPIYLQNLEGESLILQVFPFNIDLMSEDYQEGLKGFPRLLDVFETPVDTARVPPKGSLGQIEISLEMAEGKKPYVLVREVQLNRGFKKIKPYADQVPYQPWISASIEQIFQQISEKYVVSQFYAIGKDVIKVLYEDKIDSKNLRDNYVRPYQSSKWESIEIDAPDYLKETFNKINVWSYTASSPFNNQKNTGGIDLTEEKMNVETRGEGVGFDVPLDVSSPIEMMDFDGLEPKILMITPIPASQVPMLLGVMDGDPDIPLQEVRGEQYFLRKYCYV